MTEEQDYQKKKQIVLSLLEAESFYSQSAEDRIEILRQVAWALVYRMPAWVSDPQGTLNNDSTPEYE